MLFWIPNKLRKVHLCDKLALLVTELASDKGEINYCPDHRVSDEMRSQLWLFKKIAVV